MRVFCLIDPCLAYPFLAHFLSYRLHWHQNHIFIKHPDRHRQINTAQGNFIALSIRHKFPTARRIVAEDLDGLAFGTD